MCELERRLIEVLCRGSTSSPTVFAILFKWSRITIQSAACSTDRNAGVAATGSGFCSASLTRGPAGTCGFIGVRAASFFGTTELASAPSDGSRLNRGRSEIVGSSVHFGRAARKSRFRLAFQADRGISACTAKISLPFFRKMCLSVFVLIRPGGAFGQSPRTWEAGCGGRFWPRKASGAKRTSKSCGPGPPTLGSSLTRECARRWWLKSPAHQGEHV
jgi:hypothetical protein